MSTSRSGPIGNVAARPTRAVAEFDQLDRSRRPDRRPRRRPRECAASTPMRDKPALLRARAAPGRGRKSASRSRRRRRRRRSASRTAAVARMSKCAAPRPRAERDETLQIGLGLLHAARDRACRSCSRPRPRPHITFSLKQGAAGAFQPVIDHQTQRVRADIDHGDAIAATRCAFRHHGAIAPACSRARPFRKPAGATSGRAGFAERCRVPTGSDWS